MEALTLEKAIESNMTWHDVVKYYMPDATEEFCEFILWEETCFPFCAKTTMNQLNTLLNTSSKTEGDAAGE